MTVAVGNNDVKIIKFCKNKFGGAVYRVHHKSYKNVSYRWMLSHNKACEFLKLILPYLISRKEEAELGILFRKTFIKKGSNKKLENPTFTGLDKKVVERRNLLYNQMRNLKIKRKDPNSKYIKKMKEGNK